MTSTANPYDLTPYPVWAFPQTHPDAIAAMATLFGMRPRPASSCRVLEIGCARGGNLIPMAESLPESRFVGIDLSARQIEAARDVAETVGVKNIDFRQMDLADIDGSLGHFDYVVAHGVFSWIDRSLQEPILQVCADRLAPQGVAYVSYNTLPGWRMKQVVRDMMCFHGHKFDSPEQQSTQARAILDFVVETRPSERDPYGQMLRAEAKDLRTTDDAYLMHEFLTNTNEPLYFHQFIKLATAAGLQFVSEADLTAPSTYSVGPDVAATLDRVSNNHLEREQYFDFLCNRSFRRTLLCRQDVRLTREIQFPSVRSLYFVARWRELPACGLADGKLEACPTTQSALAELGEAWPAAVSFDELAGRTSARIDAELTDQQHLTLAADLFGGHVAGAVQILASRGGWAERLPQRPAMTSYARYQASLGREVTNLQHRCMTVNDQQRELIQLLDGTRDRTQLRADLHGHRVAISPDGVAEHLKRLLVHGFIKHESHSLDPNRTTNNEQRTTSTASKVFEQLEYSNVTK